MPSATFYRLPIDKQNKLIESAIKEFSRVPYHEASINVMIENAGISRGSFYVYFKDKEDIYKYILYSYKTKLLEMIDNNFDKYKGDIKETFYNIFIEITNYLRNTEYSSFFKNVFSNLNSQNENYIIPNHEEYFQQKIDVILKKIDVNKLNVTSNELVYAVEIIMNITIPSIIKSILLDIPIEKINNSYLKKLEIISKGLYRKENEKC